MHIQIKNRLGLHWKWIMLSNENLAGHCNTIRKKLEVLAHAIRLIYKSCNNGQRPGFPVFQLMHFFHSWILYSLNPLTILYFTLKMKLQLMMLFKRCSFGDTNVYMFCVVCSFERKPVWDKSPESLCQSALATFKIVLFVFIRTRMGM